MLVDGLLMLGRSAAIARAIQSPYQLVPTSAGSLRVLDTGGSKPVIVMTPDGPCVIEHHVSQIKQLALAYRVICFDLPGQGLSIPSVGFGYGIAESADVVLELMDALQVQKAIMAFSCVNGLFGLSFARQYPNRITHLVLSQTPSPAQFKHWTDQNVHWALRLPIVGQVAGHLGAARIAESWLKRCMPRNSPLLPAFTKQTRETIAIGGCFCLAGLVQGVARSIHLDLSGVDCPTLMIYGERDYSHRATDFWSLRTIAPNARIEGFETCGHFPNLEASDQYVATLLEFCA